MTKQSYLLDWYIQQVANPILPNLVINLICKKINDLIAIAFLMSLIPLMELSITLS